MLYDWFYLQSVWKNSKKLNVIKKIHKDYKSYSYESTLQL